MYFESLKGDRNDYLKKQPTKAGVISASRIDGKKEILKDSNNRALKITTPDAVYLQSYDTLILEVKNGVIKKLWFDYSVTTLKHINTFMEVYTGSINTFNKKEWENFKEMEV